jgi:all-trans-nonaprenyl-diphosphate synthase
MQGQDLASGNLTAPIIFALRNPEVSAELQDILGSEFVEDGSLQRALALVEQVGMSAVIWACEAQIPAPSILPSCECAPLSIALRVSHYLSCSYAYHCLQGGGIEAARKLAREEGDAALRCLESLSDSPAKRSLQAMVDYVLYRIY